MKSITLCSIAAALLAAALTVAAGCAQDSAHADVAIGADQVKSLYIRSIDRLDSAVITLITALQRRAATDTSATLQQQFLSARECYKRVEFLAESYNPVTAKNINGAALPKMEEDDPTRVIPPEGFQVIEEYLFPALDTTNLGSLEMEVELLRANIRRLRNYAQSNLFTDQQIFHAMRLEMVRVVTLGISGFDSPVAFNSLREAASMLSGLRDVVACYEPRLKTTSPKLIEEMDHRINSAKKYLQENDDFNSFDRLEFITEHANLLSSLLLDIQHALNIPVMEGKRMLSASARTVFDSGAFDPYYYAPHYSERGSQEVIELGRALFFDPVLSGNGQRSCASCHKPDRAFTDGVAKSVAFNVKGQVTRNAPTLLNAALQAASFYDLRVIYLEDQAAEVMSNPIEMHGSLDSAVLQLQRSAEYRQLFTRAFANAVAQPVDQKNIRVALAAYVRSLISLNAPFDRYMRGDRSQLSRSQKNGFNLFMGKGKCGTCHFQPLFNGTVPPNFTESESEILGVPTIAGASAPILDPDLGRFASNGLEVHRFSFKTPTIRNIGLTAPYMHNGAFKTLEEVIDFYDQGGGAGLGLDVPGQTLPSDRLNLTPTEQRDLIAFLHSLTDTTGLTERPVSLPYFPASSVIASRRVGGRY